MCWLLGRAKLPLTSGIRLGLLFVESCGKEDMYANTRTFVETHARKYELRDDYIAEQPGVHNIQRELRKNELKQGMWA